MPDANGACEGIGKKEEEEVETNYPFAKFNEQASAPKFSDEIYTQHLQDAGWSVEETRYLMELYEELYGKWPVIIDRYDYHPPSTESNGTAQPPAPPAPPASPRTMEDLKHRFYRVLATTTTLQTPPPQMTSAQYAHHELLLKYEPGREVSRKKIKDQQLVRSKEEKREEEHLLSELRRIYHSQEKFGAELKELRERLDHGLTNEKTSAGGGSLYQSSAEITALFQRFMQYDRSRVGNKRKSLSDQPLGPPHANIANSTGSGASPTAATANQKRASIAAEPPSRHLAPRSQARWGVVPLERGASNVSFRSEKLAKVRQAKSQAQTSKINGVLAELGIPELVQIPTTGICGAMERLVGKVTTLLEVRKNREKVTNELEVARRQVDPGYGERGQDAGEEKKDDKGQASVPPPENGQSSEEGQGGDESNAANPTVKVEAPRDDGEAQAHVETDGAGKPPTFSSTRQRNKRSASVMSASSAGSGRGNTKRARATK